jgi:hypothetical protein
MSQINSPIKETENYVFIICYKKVREKRKKITQKSHKGIEPWTSVLFDFTTAPQALFSKVSFEFREVSFRYLLGMKYLGSFGLGSLDLWCQSVKEMISYT